MRRFFRPDGLVDLSGFDLRVGVGVDEGYASANNAAAEEAHHVDDLAFRRELHASVLVENVDRVGRVLRDERDAVGPRLIHDRTMAGRRRAVVCKENPAGIRVELSAIRDRLNERGS